MNFQSFTNQFSNLLIELYLQYIHAWPNENLTFDEYALELYSELR